MASHLVVERLYTRLSVVLLSEKLPFKDLPKAARIEVMSGCSAIGKCKRA